MLAKEIQELVETFQCCPTEASRARSAPASYGNYVGVFAEPLEPQAPEPTCPDCAGAVHRVRSQGPVANRREHPTDFTGVQH